jgi:hypothetical protein
MSGDRTRSWAANGSPATAPWTIRAAWNLVQNAAQSVGEGVGGAAARPRKAPNEAESRARERRDRTQEVAGSSPASSIKAQTCSTSRFAVSAAVCIRTQELAPPSPKLVLSIPKSAVALCRVSPLPERTARYRHPRLELVVDGRTQEVAGSSWASAMKVEARFLYGFPAHGSFWLLGSSGSRSSPSVPKAPAAMSTPVEISSLRAGLKSHPWPAATGHGRWPAGAAARGALAAGESARSDPLSRAWGCCEADRVTA